MSTASRSPSTPSTSASSLTPPLRLWPGVLIAGFILFARFGLKILIPGFEGFKLSMMTTFGLMAAFILWWLFFSRAPWIERIAGLLVIVGGVAASWQLKHESMSMNWLFGYALPFVCVAFVAAAYLGRRMAPGPRRALMATAVFLATGGWALARTEGIDGDHDSKFLWRFSATAEQRLLAEEKTDDSASADLGVIADPNASRARWSGFRGPARDGAVPGIRLATDWSARPPEEIWRRPVGPGWSSFAVGEELFYTQEQRGEQEVVASYRLSTGDPVWRHGDPVRFFESNAGAGPRATPAISQGRVFTLGATGLVNALDAGDGRRLWSRDIRQDTDAALPDWGFSGSPLVQGDQVIFVAGGRLIAYDAESGELRWIGPEAGGGYNSPHAIRLGGVEQILLMSGVGATAVSPGDGSQLWRHEWGGFPMVQPAVLGGGELLISAHESSGMRRLAVTHSAAGWEVEERWTSLGLKPYFSDYAVHEGHAYGFDGRILSAIDLEDGKRVWKGGRYGSGQLILIPESDALLVLSEKGELALVAASPKGFEELARFPAIRGKTWNHPVLVDDMLLVRNAEEMAAFKLPLAGSSPNP